jgi:hypothetical protein
MDNQDLEIQASLELDLEPLKRSLSESEQLLQQGMQRMAQFAAGGDRPVVQSSGDGSAPIAPLPQPPAGGTPPPIAPTPVPTPTLPQPPEAPQQNQIESLRAEMELIKKYSQTSPDVAMAALTGQGGLNHRALRMGVKDGGENAAEYQELVSALKDLTGEVRKGAKGDGDSGGKDPMSQLLGVVRGNALMGTAMSIGNNIAGGSLLTAGGQTIGAGIGALVGGPAGLAAGATIGGMVGGAGDMFLGGAKPNEKFLQDRTDTAARFGDFGQLNGGLSFDSIAGMKRSGYSVQDTLGTIDSLRERRVITGDVDEADKALVESLQELTRATGINTNALVESYSSYRNLGGKQDPNEYMSQVVSAAIDSGFQGNIQQYQELAGSASQQLAYSSVSADTDGSGSRAVMGAIKGLMGGDSSTAALLRDNRALGGAMLNDFTNKGGAQQYSYDSAAMQIAGIDAAKTDAAFNSPEDRIRNAAMRYGAVSQNVFGDQDQGVLKQNIQNDPNYLNKLLSSDKGMQDRVNTQFQAQFGKLPTAAEAKTFTEIASNQITNDGKIDLGVDMGNGALSKQLGESQKSDAEKAREAADRRATEQMRIFESMLGVQTQMDKTMGDIYKEIADVAKEARRLYTELKPAIDGIVELVKLVTNLVPKSNPVTAIAGAADFVAKAKTDPMGAAGDAAKSALDVGLPMMGPTAPLIKAGMRAAGMVPDNDKGFFGNLADDSKEMSGKFLKYAMPGIGTFNMGMDLMSGLKGDKPQPHAKFKDTPSEGVFATPDYNLFEFAPGDRVQASASASGFTSGNDMGGGGMTYSPTIIVNADRDSDVAAIVAEVKAALSNAQDAFTAQWDGNRSAGGGGRVASNYG